MAVSQSGIQLPGHLLHITPSLTIPPLFFRSRSLPRILDSLYFPGHSLAEETKKNKVGTMNTPREFEAVRDGYTRFSMAGKWVNRNEGMRNKHVSRFSRAGFFQWGQPLPNPSGDEVSIACKYQSGNNCSCVHGSCFGVCDCRGNGIGRECSKDLKAKRIRPRHLQLSIRGDEDLNTLIKGTIASGTVIPHINRALFQNLKLSQSAGTFYY